MTASFRHLAATAATALSSMRSGLWRGASARRTSAQLPPLLPRQQQLQRGNMAQQRSSVMQQRSSACRTSGELRVGLKLLHIALNNLKKCY